MLWKNAASPLAWALSNDIWRLLLDLVQLRYQQPLMFHTHHTAACLVGSPCRHSCKDSLKSTEPASLSLNPLGPPLQGFLQLRYQQSPLKSVEPATLSLTIAPIDVIYSQLCLLRLVNFLNAAWPPPNLVSQTLQAMPSKPFLARRLTDAGAAHRASCFRPDELCCCSRGCLGMLLAAPCVPLAGWKLHEGVTSGLTPGHLSAQAADLSGCPQQPCT